MRKHLYPHKGAFSEAPFFVARSVQKEENRLYIIVLQKIRPIPRSESGKQFAASSREHERERSRKTGRSAGLVRKRSNAPTPCRKPAAAPTGTAESNSPPETKQQHPSSNNDKISLFILISNKYCFSIIVRPSHGSDPLRTVLRRRDVRPKSRNAGAPSGDGAP